MNQEGKIYSCSKATFFIKVAQKLIFIPIYVLIFEKKRIKINKCIGIYKLSLTGLFDFNFLFSYFHVIMIISHKKNTKK